MLLVWKSQVNPRQEIAETIDRMLQLVQLEGIEARYPSQLSGGQQQRVALARALAPEPNLLLLDEPLSALDALVRVDLRGEIRRIQSELGITTVYVTHDQEEALSISDRVAVMRLGTIEQIGSSGGDLPKSNKPVPGRIYRYCKSIQRSGSGRSNDYWRKLHPKDRCTSRPYRKTCCSVSTPRKRSRSCRGRSVARWL